jgi:hypothetical protein
MTENISVQLQPENPEFKGIDQDAWHLSVIGKAKLWGAENLPRDFDSWPFLLGTVFIIPEIHEALMYDVLNPPAAIVSFEEGIQQEMQEPYNCLEDGWDACRVKDTLSWAEKINGEQSVAEGSCPQNPDVEILGAKTYVLDFSKLPPEDQNNTWAGLESGDPFCGTHTEGRQVIHPAEDYIWAGGNTLIARGDKDQWITEELVRQVSDGSADIERQKKSEITSYDMSKTIQSATASLTPPEKPFSFEEKVAVRAGALGILGGVLLGWKKYKDSQTLTWSQKGFRQKIVDKIKKISGLGTESETIYARPDLEDIEDADDY